MTARRKYREARIDSWGRFVETVSRDHANWAFRGQTDTMWPLQSTLARRFHTAGIHRDAWPEQESRILQIFRRKAHLFLDHIPDEDDSFQWLAIMQHHGAPTRLLDFTWSPYVAAFFALEHATADAAIWAINPPALIDHLVAHADGKHTPVDEFGLWNRGAYEKYFLNNELSFVVYGEPQVMNQRLVAQSGTFVTPSALAVPVEAIIAKYRNAGDVLTKFVLPADKVREEAMSELYKMNITHYTLFPGLDGLARSMGYESEFNWSFDPRTMKDRPGYSDERARSWTMTE